MPGGDGTGPMGMGPMTGRAAGYCAGYSAPGYLNPIPGRGFGRGVYGAYGLGRAWGRGGAAGAPPSRRRLLLVRRSGLDGLTGLLGLVAPPSS